MIHYAQCIYNIPDMIPYEHYHMAGDINIGVILSLRSTSVLVMYLI